MKIHAAEHPFSKSLTGLYTRKPYDLGEDKDYHFYVAQNEASDRN